MLVWIILSFLCLERFQHIYANCSNKRIEYAVRIEGKAFVNHTIETIPADYDIYCPSYCHRDNRCISYTFDQELRACNLSNSDHTIHPADLVDKANSLYRNIKHNCHCSSNSKTCSINHIDGTNQCICKPGFIGKNCETVPLLSCKDILNMTSFRENKAYTLFLDNKTVEIFCLLSDARICGSGGWTLAMKIDGSKSDFEYNSDLWSNKKYYNLTAGQTLLDKHQTKLPSYWTVPFENICVVFDVNGILKSTIIPYKGLSLYDVIADGKYRATSIGKATWMSLIGGAASLQAFCNQEGFNVYGYARIGIRTNQENNCDSCDSALGVGIGSYLSCGNYCVYGSCSNKQKKTAVFGYIMIK